MGDHLHRQDLGAGLILGDPTSRVEKLTSILDVARAMSAERDLDQLLRLILREAARVVDADRCSLFLLDREKQVLWSKIAHGIGEGIHVAVGEGIVGHVARTGEPLNLADAYADPRFQSAVDRSTGYRTRTVLSVPMRNTRGDVVGVLQALNKGEGPFSREDEELLLVLGGQAATAVENALLHEEIHGLFEGFVRAAVVAIESRDPATAGHSERVAELTLGLADAVEAGGKGPWAGVRFHPDQRMEIRYAALLHDFGKVAVREEILTKAEKLHPKERERLEQRWQLARKTLEAASLKRQLDAMIRGAPDEMAREKEALALRLAELDEAWELVLACNEPSVLPAETFHRLESLASQNLPCGGSLLSPEEIRILSIPKGSLTPDERREIESHVSHTHRFLQQIPWTRGLKGVPKLAWSHHETLDGKGYPRGLTAEEIGLEARMMTIADIYDALTASDRPYKPSLSRDEALGILESDVRQGKLDPWLFELFLDVKPSGG